jgi:paraquat-inducible protein A
MSEALPAVRHDLWVCHECDAVYARHVVDRDAIVRCRRCGATLESGHWLGLDGELALALAAAVVLAIASASPIVTLQLSGQQTVATLFEAVGHTWRAGEHLVALLALATAFAFPALVIALRLWVLWPLVRQRRVPAHRSVVRVLRWATRWSMVEVFMLGILIAVVRSAGVTDIVLGPGIFGFATLTVLLTAMQAAGLQALWPGAIER